MQTRNVCRKRTKEGGDIEGVAENADGQRVGEIVRLPIRLEKSIQRNSMLSALREGTQTQKHLQKGQQREWTK